MRSRLETLQVQQLQTPTFLINQTETSQAFFFFFLFSSGFGVLLFDFSRV